MIEKHTNRTSRDGAERTGKRELNLEEIPKIILRRKKGILTIFAVSTALALLGYEIQTPEFRAVSVIMINDSKTPTDVLAAVLGPDAAADMKASKKDAELLKSMPIAELTVRELHKNNGRGALEFFGKRPYYSPLLSFINDNMPFQVINAEQQPSIRRTPDEELRRQALKLTRRIRVEPVRETNMLKVSVASPFPDEAALLTNTLCRVYRETDISRNSEKYAQAHRFLAEMLGDQKRKVAEADSELSRYMTQHQIYELSGNSQQLLGKLVEADAKNNDVRAEFHIAQNNLAFLDKKLSDTDKALSSRISQNVTTQLGSIMDEIRTREGQYVQALREKGAEDPEVSSKRQQLDVVKARYEQLSRGKIAGEIGYAGRAQKVSFDLISEKLQIQRKLNELNFSALEFGRMKQYYESQLGAMPKKQQDYIKLQRDRDVLGKTYADLKQKLDETRIMLGSEVGGVSVIGSAFCPFEPEKPDILNNLLIGLLFGGFFAAAYTFTAEMADGTIKDELFFGDLGLNTLAIIPFVDEKGETALAGRGSRNKGFFRKKPKAASETLFADDNPFRVPSGQLTTEGGSMPMITDNLTSPFAESFRTLRTSLDHSMPHSTLKSLIITGTAMSEGKSTICANLGMAYALIGKKTLIIDYDVRRASQHKKFNTEREPGLSDYLLSERQEIDSSLFQPTHLDNLYVLSAGQKVSSPNELLGSEKMIELIRRMEGMFDKVLVDCPPLFLSDAAQLADSVDAIVLVSRLQYTGRKPVQDFLDDPFYRERMVGVALIASPDYDFYGYGKYGYGLYEEEA